MKKTLLTPLSFAIAGALTAGSASAVTVYETDDAYIKLTGEVAFELIRDVDEDDKMDSKTDNVDLEVTAGYKLENGVEVFGYYAFEFASETEKNGGGDTLIDHYIGAKKDFWLVQYGDQDYAIDDFSVRVNLDAKTASERVINADDAEVNGASREVLLAKFKGDGYYVTASYDLAVDDSDTDSDNDETGYDIFAEFEAVDNLWLGAAYSLQDYDDSGDYTSYGAQVEYKGIKNLTLGAAWFFGENYQQKEKGDDVNNDATGYDLAAQYKLTKKVKVGVGYGVASPDSGNETYTDDLTTWYVNANYNFRKNLDAYAEVYDEDGDQEGFVVGISLDF